MDLESYIKAHEIGKVVDFNNERDVLIPLDFTNRNATLTDEILEDTFKFSAYINTQITQANAKYGIGGYGEHRTIYSRSTHFNGSVEEPRRLHLGVDIWGPVGTAIYNFADATVYGFANNSNYGDYGATIILKYAYNEAVFYALYGHLSKESLNGLEVGMRILKGKRFAEFGSFEENGNWPPHLHFQLIFDMQGNVSDYPGVCKFSESTQYLNNCPDPMRILKYSF